MSFSADVEDDDNDIMYGEDDPDPCLCDPCVCDVCDETEGEGRMSIKKGSLEYKGEVEGEDGGGVCTCDPCECETPPGSPVKPVDKEEEEAVEEAGSAFQLDEFSRAKAYFMNTSTKSGISLYDHLSEVIRKLLDERAPNNPVDFFEEVSMNVKRYRFTQTKDVLKDVFYISEPVLNDARFLTDNWKKYSQWSDEGKEMAGEGNIGGSFNNLLRLQYYLEQVNLGLPREEMFRLSLAIKDLTAERPFIARARFWGKIFAQRKNYYVIEAELRAKGTGDGDLWQPEESYYPPSGENGLAEGENKVPSPEATFERAGAVVLDSDFLAAYSKTSGLPADQQATLLPKQKGDAPPQAPVYNEWDGESGMPIVPQSQPGEGGMQFDDPDAAADYEKWHAYQEELMTNFPTAPEEVVVEVPSEDDGTGANRRVFYVCNELGRTPWVLLPPVSPAQINGSRQIRWSLTGDLNAPVRTYPEYLGKEGHFLKALLARAAAGALASPKGFYKVSKYGTEYAGEDDEDVDEEDDTINAPGDDRVFPMKKFNAPMDQLTQLSFWVHHSCPILPQGRNVWWNPGRPKARRRREDESEDESEDDDEEYEGEDQEAGRETGPPLFTAVTEDVAVDGRAAWTLQTSSSVFKEFQVVSARSNSWPGSTVICTVKGKVDNIYLGDGLKFLERSYAPPCPDLTMTEYRPGPEVEEFPDPSVEEEQKWLDRLELNQIADIEARFVDNEGMDEDGEYSDEDY